MQLRIPKEQYVNKTIISINQIACCNPSEKDSFHFIQMTSLRNNNMQISVHLNQSDGLLQKQEYTYKMMSPPYYPIRLFPPTLSKETCTNKKSPSVCTGGVILHYIHTNDCPIQGPSRSSHGSSNFGEPRVLKSTCWYLRNP